MSKDKIPIPINDIFDAVGKCRTGDISEQLAEIPLQPICFGVSCMSGLRPR